MKNKFFVEIPESNIKTLMSFVGQISHYITKTQEDFVRLASSLFEAEYGEEIKEGNISCQIRGEVSFTVKKRLCRRAILKYGKIFLSPNSLYGRKIISPPFAKGKTNCCTQMAAMKNTAQKKPASFWICWKIIVSFPLNYRSKNSSRFFQTSPLWRSAFSYEKLREKNLNNRPAENHAIFPELYA